MILQSEFSIIVRNEVQKRSCFTIIIVKIVIKIIFYYCKMKKQISNYENELFIMKLYARIEIPRISNFSIKCVSYKICNSDLKIKIPQPFKIKTQ